MFCDGNTRLTEAPGAGRFAAMPSTSIDLTTNDKPCHTQIITPEGAGPWPAVIVCFDAGGQREPITEIGERLAKSGYLAVIPDLYHRAGDIWDVVAPNGEPHDMSSFHAMFGDPARRAEWMSRFYTPALDYKNLEDTIGAVLKHLEGRPDFRGGVGTTGYCMGGNASFRIATIFGDRIAATATFHAGGLVTPAPDSPHTKAAAIKSKVYVAGAKEDGSFNDEAKATLIEALKAAHVDAEVETYDAHHGFAVRDNPTFTEEASERHYAAMNELFGATLKK